MNSSPVADRFRRNAARFTEIVDAVDDDAWGRPSPCAEWDASGVLRHVVDTERDFLARFDFGDPPPAPGDDCAPAELAAAWAATRDRMQSLLDDPTTAEHGYDGHFGPTTFAATADTFYVADLVTHGWDLARAAGLSELEPLDETEMATIRAAMEPLGDAVRGPGVFGPEVDVSTLGGDETSTQDRFLAWSGRHP